MGTYHRVCVLCYSDTYYNCVKCPEAVCNRPDCSAYVHKVILGIVKII